LNSAPRQFCKAIRLLSVFGVTDRTYRLKDQLCYVGSYVSFNGSCAKDVKIRIGKAAASVIGKMKKIRH